MVIKKVAFNTFDVFLGNGWDHWIRMNLVGSNWITTKGDPSLAGIASSILSKRFK